MTAKKPTVEQVYVTMQALRNLGLEPRYFNVEAIARGLAKGNAQTMEQVRRIAAHHFNGPDVERP